MKRIGIYFFCVVALGCVTSSILYRKSEEANEIRLETGTSETPSEVTEVYDSENSTTAQETVIEVSDHAASEERFFVIEEDGYLVIYDRQTKRRYDETTILFNDLPERLQERIE